MTKFFVLLKTKAAVVFCKSHFSTTPLYSSWQLTAESSAMAGLHLQLRTKSKPQRIFFMLRSTLALTCSIVPELRYQESFATFKLKSSKASFARIK